MVGLGSEIDWPVEEYVFQWVRGYAGGGENRELVERSSTILVGKFEADLLGEYGAAEVYLHRPVVEGIAGGGLPKGCGIAVDDPSGGIRVAAGFPDATRYVVAPRAGSMGKKMSISSRVDVLAKFDQLQLACVAELD